MKISDNSNTVQYNAYAGMPVNGIQLKGILLPPSPGWPKNRYFTWINYLTYLSAHNDHIRSFSSTRDIISQHNATTFQVNSSSKIANINNPLHQCTNLSTEGIGQAITLNSLPICPSESIFRGVHAFDSVQKHENSSNSSTE
ncbi:unnamed protein product [Trichobilharzia regenti]|nr:unnamed protein product [Trichobilharzia regenti]